MSGGCSPLVPGVFSFQPFEMMAPSWLYFLTVAWGQGGTDHISVAESAAVLNTFLLPCSCCCLPVPIPVPVAIPISSVPCFSFTQLGATDLTYTEPVLCALCTQQGSVAPGLSRCSACCSAAAPGQGGGSSRGSLDGQVLCGTCCTGSLLCCGAKHLSQQRLRSLLMAGL